MNVPLTRNNRTNAPFTRRKRSRAMTRGSRVTRVPGRRSHTHDGRCARPWLWAPGQPDCPAGPDCEVVAAESACRGRVEVGEVVRADAAVEAVPHALQGGLGVAAGRGWQWWSQDDVEVPFRLHPEAGLDQAGTPVLIHVH